MNQHNPEKDDDEQGYAQLATMACRLLCAAAVRPLGKRDALVFELSRSCHGIIQSDALDGP
jgi:hypothetical protein